MDSLDKGIREQLEAVKRERELEILELNQLIEELLMKRTDARKAVKLLTAALTDAEVGR